ncbi:MFS transporter [Pseudonocardia oceani]|uniref:MFS transporter n=5 Tax=Pseudonocardia oceani TaxID=2792013 RepID=A0ABS6UB85_9PSEU|nr:MFS transporter [Pseudonocardia oceani]MBW0119861.1 MFS transporter [Pseudonocardia oceani]MBW0129424.1 MFS transporter [Pseudonocardia oceani]
MRSWPFRLMLLATVLGFGGYALLLPVVPLWVSGAGELAAGSTTGALMLTTIGTQLAVPWLVARLGYRTVLGTGLVLLGGPTPLLALSAELGPVVAVSAARGVGFGLLTVVGSALVAELAAPSEHGRAAARYGIAVGVPQLVLLPAGVAVVDVAGFTGVFVAAGAAPLLGLLALPALRVPRPTPAAVPVAGEPAPPRTRHAVAPLVAMLSCSVAQGGLVTFLPLAVPGAAGVVAAALFTTAAGALLGRTAAGRLVDRHGLGGGLLLPGVLLAAAGMAVEVLALGGAAPLVVVGAAAVGVGFGLVQNDSLTTLFAASGPAGYGSASAVWNIAYDAGTGVGAVGLGAVADPFGFRAAFGLSAIALLVVGAASRRSR